jgi:hypothetical protein
MVHDTQFPLPSQTRPVPQFVPADAADCMQTAVPVLQSYLPGAHVVPQEPVCVHPAPPAPPVPAPPVAPPPVPLPPVPFLTPPVPLPSDPPVPARREPPAPVTREPPVPVTREPPVPAFPPVPEFASKGLSGDASPISGS